MLMQKVDEACEKTKKTLKLYEEVQKNSIELKQL